jgi:hypothetical protein
MAGKGSPKGVKQGGRKPGTPNKATAEVKAYAQQYAPAVLEELARLATKAKSEQARVAAGKEILDRAYGKATQPMQHSVDEGLEALLDRVGGK